MDAKQFSQLREDMSAYVLEICTKLEQIRCGIIDVEIELNKINSCNTTQQCNGRETPVCNCMEWKDITAGWCPVHGALNSCH